jgi:antitoxin component YwqK of YwqJK toxin-antitoxin module
MKMILLFTISIGIESFLSAQTATLNSFDDKGKKHGKWVVYLDKNWKKKDDSAGAVFYRYTFYEHGTNLHPMGTCGGTGYQLQSPSTEGVALTVKVLDGEYKWYDKKGALSSVHVFKNGEYVACREYYPSGELHQFFDYTRTCDGEPHSWYVSVYDKKGNLTFGSFMCKDANGNLPRTRG